MSKKMRGELPLNATGSLPAGFEQSQNGMWVPVIRSEDTSTATAAVKSRAEKTADILERLSPERRQRAEDIILAMAEKFGLAPENFSVIWRGLKLVAMLSTRDGLKKGTWNDIMDPQRDEDFTVEVEGQAIDTRTAMKSSTYRAFYQAIIEDVVKAKYEVNGSSHVTFLTGDLPKLSRNRGRMPARPMAPYAFIENGVLYEFGRTSIDYNDGHIHFRPAAVIPKDPRRGLLGVLLGPKQRQSITEL